MPAVSPGFVADRLRTTFAPRIGKPDQHACRTTTAKAAQHTHPSFPPQRSPLLRSTGRPRPHSRVTKRVRTYNHLPGGRHGAFASKPGENFPKKVTAPSHRVMMERNSPLSSNWMVTPRIWSLMGLRPGDQGRRAGQRSGRNGHNGRVLGSRPAEPQGYRPSVQRRAACTNGPANQPIMMIITC